MKKILCLLSAIIMFSAGFVGCGTAVPDREVFESTTVTEPTTITETTTSTKVEMTSKAFETTTEPKEKATIATKKTVSSSASKTTKRAENKVTVKPTEKEKTAATTKKAVTTETKKIVAYSCGCKNHHCKSKEDHDIAVYFENIGCDICGSHSCPSFYALDEWGQQCYDISKCPQYSEKKDPCIYCQYCNKKCGTGGNNTCVRFTVDTECPECGKFVKAKTCHSH